jgi:hypothetical protein
MVAPFRVSDFEGSPGVEPTRERGESHHTPQIPRAAWWPTQPIGSA